MIKKLLYSSLFLNLLFIIAGLLAIHFLGGYRYVLFKMKNRGLAGEYEHRKQLFMHLELVKGDIVFLGNSITAQCEWAELLQNPKIKNRGIPGDVTDGILARLAPITKAEPEKIFLMIGINDLLFHPVDYIASNYQKIVDSILTNSPETELLVYSVLPVNNQVRNTTIKNKDIEFLNKKIVAIAKTKKLTYIDLHEDLADENGKLDAKYTADGIHINGAAYMIWKQKILPFLN